MVRVIRVIRIIRAIRNIENIHKVYRANFLENSVLQRVKHTLFNDPPNLPLMHGTRDD